MQQFNRLMKSSMGTTQLDQGALIDDEMPKAPRGLAPQLTQTQGPMGNEPSRPMCGVFMTVKTNHHNRSHSLGGHQWPTCYGKLPIQMHRGAQLGRHGLTTSQDISSTGTPSAPSSGANFSSIGPITVNAQNLDALTRSLNAADIPAADSSVSQERLRESCAGDREQHLAMSRRNIPVNVGLAGLQPGVQIPSLWPALPEGTLLSPDDL